MAQSCPVCETWHDINRFSQLLPTHPLFNAPWHACESRPNFPAMLYMILVN